MLKMRNIQILTCVMCVIATAGTTLIAAEPEIAWGETVTQSIKPAIWMEAEGKDILAAEEVARVDAFRKLRGRIYGLVIDAETDIHDMVLSSAEFKAVLNGELKGMKELKWRYLEDGRCEVAVRVTIREIIETITTSYKKYKTKNPKRRNEIAEKLTKYIKVETKDTKIIVVGNGALKGSQGLRMIRARRAAEVDAYRKLVEKVLGLHVDSKSTVKDFVLARDVIQTKLANCVKGMRITSADYIDGKICEVTGKITVVEVVEFLKRVRRRYLKDGKWTEKTFEKMRRENIKKVIKVVGKGAIVDFSEDGSQTGDDFFEDIDDNVIELFIKKTVIKREIGVVE